MEAILLIVVVLLAGVVMLVCRHRRGPALPASAEPSARPDATGRLPGTQPTITLDLDVEDHPAVQRLVRAAASHAFRTSPHVDAVMVEDRSGRRLGLVERDERLSGPAPVTPEVPEPERRRPQPSLRSSREPSKGGREDRHAAHRSLADRLDLPDVVRSHLRRPDDPVDVVRAILQAARLPAEVQGNVILSGSEAVIVVAETGGLPSVALTEAFLRFQKTGASRGVVIALGYVGARDVERRQALAPNLRYTGLSAIQRMADAVAVGANPLRFAMDPETAE